MRPSFWICVCLVFIEFSLGSGTRIPRTVSPEQPPILSPNGPSRISAGEGIPTGRTFIRPVQSPSESGERYIAPSESFVSDEITTDDKGAHGGKLTAVPGVDDQGRWFFDWFWGYDQPEYPPPLVPRPAPVYPGPYPSDVPRPALAYPHPYPPDIPLEVCTEMHNPVTLDIYEECYPLD